MSKQAHAKKPEKKAALPTSSPRKTTKRSSNKSSAAEDRHDAKDARLALREGVGISWEDLKSDLEL